MARDKQTIINEIAFQEKKLQTITNEIIKVKNEIQDLFAFSQKYQIMISKAEEKQASKINKINSSPIQPVKSKIFTAYSSQMNEILKGNESNQVFQGLQFGLNEINQTTQKQENRLDELNHQKSQIENCIDNLYRELNSLAEDEQESE